MKKKLLAILLALVLCLSLVAAVACDPDKPDVPDGPTGNIPTEEGKVTLYWKVINSVNLTDIASYFLIGGPNGWTTGNTDYELKQLNDTDTFYVFMDPEVATGAEYKVVIGYNSKSPVDVGQQGPFWSNEGYGSKTWAPGGANSVVPEFTGNTVDCGTIEFDGCLGDPIPVTNFDVKVSIKKGQLDTETAEVYIMGHFSGWANMPNDSKIKAVLDTSEANSPDLDVYKIHVDEMFAKDAAEYLVLIFPHGIGDKITKDDGSDADIWAYFNRAGSDAIKVCDFTSLNDDGTHGNAKIKVSDLYSDDYMDIANTVAEGSKAKGLDLSKKVENKDKEGEGLGNYELDINADVADVEVTFSVTFDTAIPETMNVYLAGSMEGWSGTLMETEDNLTYTITITMKENALGEFEFKVIVIEGSFAWSGGVEFGAPKADGTGMDNAKVSVTDGGTVQLFDETQHWTAE